MTVASYIVSAVHINTYVYLWIVSMTEDERLTRRCTEDLDT